MYICRLVALWQRDSALRAHQAGCVLIFRGVECDEGLQSDAAARGGAMGAVKPRCLHGAGKTTAQHPTCNGMRARHCAAASGARAQPRTVGLHCDHGAFTLAQFSSGTRKEGVIYFPNQERDTEGEEETVRGKR